jgi:hypothetical protein
MARYSPWPPSDRPVRHDWKTDQMIMAQPRAGF